MKSVSTANNKNGTNECHKCGTSKKSGKRSCCARGGAWFKNCGDKRETEFDHSWAEGIQSCESVATAVSVESQLTLNLRVVGAVDRRRKCSKPCKGSDRGVDVYPPDRTVNVGIVDEGSDGLSKVVGYISTLLYWFAFADALPTQVYSS